MNKGIAIHLIVSLVYILTIMWVVQDDPIDIYVRAMIAVAFIGTNAIVSVYCSDEDDKNNLYKQKL